MKELTPKQKKFVDVYDGNIRTSSEGAGFTYGYGRQLMTLPRHEHVRMAIATRELTRSNNRIASREERQELWSSIMRGELELDRVDGDGKPIKIKPGFQDIARASENLGKSEADFTEKVEHSGKTIVQIVKFGD